MEQSLQDSDKQLNLLSTIPSTRLGGRGFFASAFFAGIILTIFLTSGFGFLFSWGYSFLNSFQWFYADLWRSCDGMFCAEPTLPGVLLVGFFCFICSFVTASALWWIYTRSHKWHTAFLVLVFVLTPITFLLFSSGVGVVAESIPDMPTSFRCASVINNTSSKLDYGDAIFGGSGRVNCVFELALEHGDISWCQRLEDDLLKTRCVGAAAKKFNDFSLCNSLDNKEDQAVCRVPKIEGIKDVPASQISSSLAVGSEELSGVPLADSGHTNYFSSGDVVSTPVLRWTKDGSAEWGDPNDPLPLNQYVAFNSDTKEDKYSNIIFHKNADGQAVWGLNPTEYFSGSHQTPIVLDGIILYNDFHKLFAHSIVTGKALWQKDVEYIGAPIIGDGSGLFVLADTSGSTGYPVSLKSLDLLTGHERWSTSLGKETYAKESIVLSDTSVFLTARSVHAPLKAIIYILDKSTGKIKNTIERLSGESESSDGSSGGVLPPNPPSSAVINNIVGGPLFADGMLFVRTGDTILVIDEQKGSIVKEYKEFADLSRESGTMEKALHMAYHDKNLYYSDGDRSIMRRDTESGQVVWRSSVEEKIITSPIITATFVYLATEKYMYAYRRDTGAFVWKFELVDTIRSNIAAKDGYIYFISRLGRLNVLK